MSFRYPRPDHIRSGGLAHLCDKRVFSLPDDNEACRRWELLVGLHQHIMALAQADLAQGSQQYFVVRNSPFCAQRGACARWGREAGGVNEVQHCREALWREKVVVFVPVRRGLRDRQHMIGQQPVRVAGEGVGPS